MAPSASPLPSATNSGIRKLSNGDSIIPSSTRADGSVRKQIRVKPGYKPPEDVEVYKNRTAEAFKNRGKGGVPGAAKSDETEANGMTLQQSAAAIKNAKRREARKKAASASAGDGADGVEEKDGVSAKDGATAAAAAEPVDAEAEAAKEAKKLAKKLRQARELQDKKEKGDSLLPEQFAKVIKMNELIRQLDCLGFDANGERKGAASGPEG